MLDSWEPSGFYTADMHIDDVINEVLAGHLPSEFIDSQNQINMRLLSTPSWAMPIMEQAKRRLGAYLQMDLDAQAYHGKDIKQFDSKHKYTLTRSMYDAGWRQWQSTINTITREEAEKQNIKFKSRRYACHFWVGPNKEIVFGKIKLEGKWIPGGAKHFDEGVSDE